MPCDPNALLNSAKCFQCLSEKQLEMVVSYLLCQISNGDGDGLFQFNSGVVNPTSAPTSPNLPAQYLNTETGFLFNWNIATQAWIGVPKAYQALLTQTGTNAPTAVVTSNTLGFVPTFTYVATGIYTIEFGTPVAIPKIICDLLINSSLPLANNQLTEYGLQALGGSPTSNIFMFTTMSTILTDGLLTSTPIDLRIYP